jgi:hypothetical protein
VAIFAEGDWVKLYHKMGFAKKIFHALPNPARAWSKVADVPDWISPGRDPG